LIRSTVYSIEKHFVDNWTGEVNFEQPNYIAKGNKWIEIIVTPLSSENVSIEGCTLESYDLALLAYGKNKVEAGELLDLAIASLQNSKIDEVTVRGWRNIANGMLDTSTYFYKVAFTATT